MNEPVWSAASAPKQVGHACAPPRSPGPAGQGTEYPPGPSRLRAVSVIATLIVGVWLLSRVGRGPSGEDAQVTRLGRIEVTARLLSCPDPFPDLGAYRYTYVVPYEVLEIHRQDPAGKYALKPGDRIFVGHYRPRLPRDQIQDEDWGDRPLGGKLTRFVAGDVHRMALDYELSELAPSGALDYCYPPEVNRFFAIWTNRVGNGL